MAWRGHMCPHAGVRNVEVDIERFRGARGIHTMLAIEVQLSEQEDASLWKPCALPDTSMSGRRVGGRCVKTMSIVVHSAVSHTPHVPTVDSAQSPVFVLPSAVSPPSYGNKTPCSSIRTLTYRGCSHWTVFARSVYKASYLALLADAPNTCSRVESSLVNAWMDMPFSTYIACT